MNYIKHGKLLWMPFVAIIVASVILFSMGYENAAWIVSHGGTLLAFIGIGFYVVVFDPRNHWPGKTPAERLHRVFTFRR